MKSAASGLRSGGGAAFAALVRATAKRDYALTGKRSRIIVLTYQRIFVDFPSSIHNQVTNPMTEDFRLADLITSVADQMRTALRERLINHPGELGTGREEIIRRFFRTHLPKRFRVDGGFAFDSHGNLSREMDLMIYDAMHAPAFLTSGGKLLVPCESVVCAGQIKSSLTSHKGVWHAFENLASIRHLARTTTERIGGRELGFREIEREIDHLDEIFTFVFIIGRSPSRLTMVEQVFENALANVTEWPNIVFALDKYLITYACPDGVCPNTHHAQGVACVSERPADELLLRFFLLVARAAVMTNVWKFSYWDHLNESSAKGADVFPFELSPLWPDERTYRYP